jgi:transglutaminase-like putative cysteine protease
VLFTVENPRFYQQKIQPGNSARKDDSKAVGSARQSLELAGKANEIAGEEKDPVLIAEKLTRWVAENIKESADDFIPTKALSAGKGDCLSRARLYAALAREAGIQSRVVTGLVYQENKGFLFHAWAESLAGKWLPVDPSLGQTPADVTHIKLAEGETPLELALLASVIGQLEAKVVEELY